MTDSRNSRKVRTGVVTSVSGAKTIVVTITERKRHQVRQDDDQLQEAARSRRGVHGWRGRYRPRYGDPSYVQDEALAPHRGRRAR